MESEIGPGASDSSRSVEAGAGGAPFAPVDGNPAPVPANPYGYPPYGYPPYGYPFGYAPQPPAGTNGLAIASFVLGICGFLFVTAIVGLVFGIVSRSAVRKSGQKGRNFAVGGIGLSGVWIAVFVAIITIAAINTPDVARRDAHGNVVSPGAVPVFGLHPKDCFTLPAGAIGSDDKKATSMKVVPCWTAHDSEAFGSFTLAEGSFPGMDDVRAESNSQCMRQLDSFNPDPASLPGGPRVQFIYPDQQAWDRGVHTVTCFLQFPAAAMTQSVSRDPSTFTADQLRFLKAVDPLSDAIGQLAVTPQSADVSELQARATDIANATWSEVAALKAQPWPSDVQPAVDALVANHSDAAPLWEQAVGSDDTASLEDIIGRASAAFSVKDMIAARNALGLVTASSGSVGGSGGSQAA